MDKNSLFTCPDCGLGQLSKRNLATHRGNRLCKHMAEMAIACGVAENPSSAVTSTHHEPKLRKIPSDRNPEDAGQLAVQRSRGTEKHDQGKSAGMPGGMVQHAADAGRGANAGTCASKSESPKSSGSGLSGTLEAGQNASESEGSKEVGIRVLELAARVRPGSLCGQGTRIVSNGSSSGTELEVVSENDAEFFAFGIAQYGRAVGGMRDVIAFGAWMKLLRQRLSPIVRTRTVGGQLNGSSRENGSLSACLEEHAPGINRQTAYRLEAVFDAVAEQFSLSKTLASKTDLPTLVLSSPDALAALDPKLPAKQLELWTFVDGTSQRSWLDRLRPMKALGGRRERNPDKATPSEDTAEQAAIDLWTPLLKDLAEEGIGRKSWADLPAAMIQELKGLLKDIHTALP